MSVASPVFHADPERHGSCDLPGGENAVKFLVSAFAHTGAPKGYLRRKTRGQSRRLEHGESVRYHGKVCVTESGDRAFVLIGQSSATMQSFDVRLD